MRTDGDCGLWSLGNRQPRESFAADSKSRVQWDPTSSHYGRPPRQFTGLCRTGKLPLPGQGLLFTNIPRSAFRIPHFPPSFRFGDRFQIPQSAFRNPHFPPSFLAIHV